MLESFTFDTFSNRVGESFRVDADGAARELQLEECTPLGGRALERAPFSLLFLETGAADVLPQRIYPFEHDELGSFEMFIVPISHDADGARYEAVFT